MGATVQVLNGLGLQGFAAAGGLGVTTPTVFTVRATAVVAYLQEDHAAIRIAERLERFGWKVHGFAPTFQGISFFPPGRKLTLKMNVSKPNATEEDALRAVQLAMSIDYVSPGNVKDWLVSHAEVASTIVKTTEESVTKASQGEIPTSTKNFVKDLCLDTTGFRCRTIGIAAGIGVGVLALAAFAPTINAVTTRLIRRR